MLSICLRTDPVEKVGFTKKVKIHKSILPLEKCNTNFFTCISLALVCPVSPAPVYVDPNDLCLSGFPSMEQNT